MSEPGVLDKIAASTQRRVAAAKAALPAAALRERVSKVRVPHDFKAAFQSPGLHVIAEVKRASPSAGSLGKDLDPVAIAREYAAAGASAISVLTEPEFFSGDLEHLSAVRRKVMQPLLMKDFVIDEYQLLQGRIFGADAVLLIAALLGEDKLRRLLDTAVELGLSALVEVHDAAELEAALSRGAKLIGVNNRNLKTLEVDLDVARRLAEQAEGRGAVLICESGLTRREELVELSGLGYNGFLIGTHLIRSGRPGEALAELLRGAVR